MRSKILFILFVSFVLCFALVSCGGEDTSKVPETTDEANETAKDITETVETLPEATAPSGVTPTLPEGVDPDKYYKFVEFELAEGDPRQIVVDYMRKQAHVEWVAANTINLKNDLGSWDVDLEYKRGETYYGMIYSNLNSSLHKFESELKANNGRFRSDATSWEGYYRCRLLFGDFEFDTAGDQ
ncbi:MAG: hypothetical protein E7615_03485 [Ruminococcaceae bacterium]|nr:hypothetical protein [Oscillospiraceae bacterium]